MRILAVDTALSACSACVLDAGAREPLARRSEAMDRGHAEALVPMLADLERDVPGGFASLDRISVTVGPGSFTGLRVGLAAARAMGVGLGIPVVGVGTLAAFAAPAVASDGTLVVVSVIDARHGNVYVQAVSPGGRLLVSPRIAPLREAARAVGGSAVRIVGPAADLLASAALDLGLQIFVDPPARAPDILWVARLGLAADPAHAPPDPLYLRDADAKPQGHARIARA